MQHEIIDFHTHIYPDAIAAKAADNVRGFYDGLGDSGVDGRVQTLLKYGDLAGISEFAVLPVAIKPERTRHINEFICHAVADQPRFYGFGTLHAAMEGLMDEVSFIMDNGLHGIKIHPDYQVFAIDDIRMYPVYEEIQGKRPIVFHMGDLRYDYSHPTRLKKVLKDFPKLQTVAAHFGGYQMREIACEDLENTNCFRRSTKAPLSCRSWHCIWIPIPAAAQDLPSFSRPVRLIVRRWKPMSRNVALCALRNLTAVTAGSG